jgi:hypothetical protein
VVLDTIMQETAAQSNKAFHLTAYGGQNVACFTDAARKSVFLVFAIGGR